MKALCIVVMLVPAGAFAASSWDGTWKLRVSSYQGTGKPQSFEIVEGMYSCNSCVPPYKVKADGTAQPVSGHSYADNEAVKVVDATTVEITDQKAGKTVFRKTLSVSADGKTLSVKFRNHHLGQIEADFDGKENRLAGDPGKTTVSLERVDAKTIEETNRRAGRVTAKLRFVLAEDGKSMSVVDHDLSHDTKTSLIYDKQP
jgi:hypothetical protein